MTLSMASGDAAAGGALAPNSNTSASIGRQHPEPIPGTFQIGLGLYILLTGSVPQIIQAAVFGLSAASGYEFSLAMFTETVRDLLLVAPVLSLSRHPLGVLHPLLLSVVVWPLLSSMPSVINDYGGWAGVIAGVPVETPHFIGLPSRSASEIWIGIAKFNFIQILGLLGTYAGFFLLAGRPNLLRRAYAVRQPASIRVIMIGLIAISLIVLYFFVRSRGGINAHLTSLGGGRFRELSGSGPIIVFIDVGTAALMVWIAAKTDDIKSPIFLLAMASVMAIAFISNGSRGSAILVPMKVGLIWALRRNRVPWKTAFIMLPLLFVSIGLLGAIRTSSWYGSTANKALAKTSWAQSLALSQQEVDDRQAVSANVPVVERGFAVSGGPLLGRSYAAVFSAFIPRPLWRDKPRGVGSLYARWFLGASFEGTTIPVSPEVEMYWNFGFLGVVLLTMISGILLRKVYNFYWRHYLGPFATVIYVLFATVFRFSSDRLVILEQQVFEVLFCYAIVALFVPKLGYTATGAQNRYAVRPIGSMANGHA